MNLLHELHDVLSVKVELSIDVLDAAVEVVGRLDPFLLVLE
jgi:hypothetical protein